ncbi:MAG TPA: hypothetical protein VK864_11775, partial [Longimicrobiales bacterium]|nr:hypothetical protein [Longimicrobiales bacterium]
PPRDGTPAPDVSINNHMATFTGSIAGLPVGSARRERATIRQGQQLSYEIDVPAGSTSLLVRASNVSDPAADLDVYAIDCTGRQCRTRQTDSDPVGDEIVTIQNPAAGKWKVIVDAAHLPSGSASFDYADVVFNPSYGAVTTSDVAKEHKTGEPWTAKTHAWFANALPAGRQPFTAVLLQGSLGGGATFPLSVLELGSATAAASSQQR